MKIYLRICLLFIIFISSITNSVFSQTNSSPFGIFEVYGYPKFNTTLSQQFFGYLGVSGETEFYNNVDVLINDVDLKWTRCIFILDGTSYNPSVYEDKIYRLNQQNVNIIATVEINAYPNNEAEYLDRIVDTIEAFDEDGDADTIKPTRIKYWQICNEVNFTTYWTGTPEEYAHLLYISYNAIKAADPQAKVFIAGEASTDENDPTFYSQIIDELVTNGLYNTAKRFDYTDIHVYGAYDEYSDIETYINRYNGYLQGTIYQGTPIWITEAGTYTGDPDQLPYQPQIESDQAQSLVKRYITSFKKDVEKVFWSPGLVEHYAVSGTPDEFFDLMGLIYNGSPNNDTDQDRGPWLKKKAYYSFKALIDIMGDDVEYINKLSFTNQNIYGYKLRCGTKNCYVLWNDISPANASFNAETPSVNVTNLIVNDGNTIPTQYILNGSPGNTMSLIVDENPVILEEIPLSSPTPTPTPAPLALFTYCEDLISNWGLIEIADTEISSTILNEYPTSRQIKESIIGDFNNTSIRFSSLLGTNVILDMGENNLIDIVGDDLSVVKTNGSGLFKVEVSNDPDFETGVLYLGDFPSSPSRTTMSFNLGSDDMSSYRYVKLTLLSQSSGFADIERVQAIQDIPPTPTSSPTPTPTPTISPTPSLSPSPTPTPTSTSLPQLSIHDDQIFKY